MRALPVLCLLLAACQLPEDPLFVSGRVVRGGVPRSGVEVRLLRNLTVGAACDDLEVIATAVTATDGTYRFDLIRQQVTLGVSRDRWFRVAEAFSDDGAQSSFTFQFVDAPMVLPDLPLFDTLPPMTGGTPWSFTRYDEVLLDGHVAWRTRYGGLTLTPPFDRDTLLRAAWTQYQTLQVEENDLGISETAPLDLRIEAQSLTFGPGTDASAPVSRGALCPGLDIEPCPLTDGRNLPVELPPDFRAVVLDLGKDVAVNEVQLYGARFLGAPVKLKVEWSPVSPPSWAPYNSAPLSPADLVDSGHHCEEPGAFIRADVAVARFPKPRLIRLTAPGADGQLVPWLGLQEVVVR